MESKESTLKYGISRFNNIDGITCYMNSILHILQQIPIFADYMYIGAFSDIFNHKFENQEDKIRRTVSYELYRVFTASMNNDFMAITPTSFKYLIGQKCDRWNEQNHQDSPEFYNFLISTLYEEIGDSFEFIPGGPEKIYKNPSFLSFLGETAWRDFQRKEYSILKELFDGLYYNQKKCKCCSNTSNTFEPFTMLQLAIPMKDTKTEMMKDFTIKECFDHLIADEQLDDDNKYDCPMCGLSNKANQKLLLWRTPKILVIQIKRFIINNYGIRTQKLVNNIEYPIYNLDLSPYIHSDSPYIEKSKYNLIGINMHQEFSRFGLNSGHYTSIVKNRMDDNWYLFNDGAKPIKATRREHLQNRNAYLLFYYRNDENKMIDTTDETMAKEA